MIFVTLALVDTTNSGSCSDKHGKKAGGEYPYQVCKSGTDNLPYTTLTFLEEANRKTARPEGPLPLS